MGFLIRILLFWSPVSSYAKLATGSSNDSLVLEEVIVTARNFGNKITSNHGDELPFMFVGSYFQFVVPGRSLTLQRRTHF